MINSATACATTQPQSPTKVKNKIDWVGYLNELGKLYALSHVSRLK